MNQEPSAAPAPLHVDERPRADAARRARRWAFAGFLAGLLVIAALVAHFGFAKIMGALAAVGWRGLLLLCLAHLLEFSVMGAAWWALVRKDFPGRLRLFIWSRMIRDAGSEALPLSQLGGYVLGALALTRRGVPAAVAAASTAVDVTLEVVAQIAFVLLGLLLLAQLEPGNDVARRVAFGLGILAVLIALFLRVQRRGFGRMGKAFADRFGRWFSAFASGLGAVAADTRRIHADPAALIASTLLHLVAWLGIGLEAWLALHLLHVDMSLRAALSIESLMFALRSLAFAVPNAAGVQEAAYLLLSGAFGLSPTAVLSLSLLKRARDLLLGLSTITLWNLLPAPRGRHH
jgi:putative membrane protein